MSDTGVMVTVSEESTDSLASYASISSAYLMIEVLDLDSPAPAGGLLPYVARPIDAVVVKDYDELPDNHPLDWPARFDVARCGFFAAHIGTRRVGGAVVIPRDTGGALTDLSDDVALLWDIRVAPMARNYGVGTALLAACETWARDRGARIMKVETQNTNVPACRFYARSGFSLRDIRRGAYAELPNEVELLWYREIVP